MERKHVVSFYGIHCATLGDETVEEALKRWICSKLKEKDRTWYDKAVYIRGLLERNYENGKWDLYDFMANEVIPQFPEDDRSPVYRALWRSKISNDRLISQKKENERKQLEPYYFITAKETEEMAKQNSGRYTWEKLYGARELTPTKVICNGPATIFFWPDKTKTVVKCSEKDRWDLGNAYANAVMKKIFGNGTWAKRAEKVLEDQDFPDAKKMDSCMYKTLKNQQASTFTFEIKDPKSIELFVKSLDGDKNA